MIRTNYVFNLKTHQYAPSPTCRFLPSHIYRSVNTPSTHCSQQPVLLYWYSYD